MVPRSRAFVRLAAMLLLGGGVCFLVLHVLSAEPAPAGALEPVVLAPWAPADAALRSLDVAGRRRTFHLHRGTRAAAAAPLWVVLHGSGGSGEEVQRMHAGAFDRLADREGLLVAYPDGYDEHWNDCRPRADYAANLENVDDVGFLRRLVEDLHVGEDIDLEQVTVVGISNGGQMVFRLAFEAADVAQTYVALLANLPVPQNDDCVHSGEGVRMLLINGSEDPINPAGGGLVTLAGNTSRGAVLSAAETAQAFAKLAGHTKAAEERSFPDRWADDGTTIESFEWRSSGQATVTWIRVVGGGHSVPTTATLRTWPPATAAYLLETYGRQSQEFETVEVVWRFSSSPGARLL